MDNFPGLSGKTAIVTGSTQGIGRCIAETLAKAGANVVISSEDSAAVTATTAALTAAGHAAHGLACDVTDEAALRALVEGTVAHFGGLDILVCNAGITGTAGTWALDDFDRVMAVNLRSLVALTGLALPHIAARGGGSVILMSSLSALRGNGAINAYALAKAGVAQLARNLAVQWGPQAIRVNALAPGLIHTPLSEPLLADEAFMARRLQMTPLRRVGTVAEVASACLFLASPVSSFITGQHIAIDGGTSITDGS
ncbi:MAG: short-chain dehydrogenase [Novosphingobium sp. 28-62-57]|uniref:SDR family NAD(P)-dependent oxidoreductase n=1 Tax=unclassified Novosphingobium TaxID=2644732 RepID=UPI000BC4850E|nr:MULTISPECIES: SDR family NAD(P)-dependent oxidoreductase [unclassified Novosphingobium]OYW49256.1 MAG: short-chain dehydrogenase [Novosphingobium sp. 12-62-10]OYZ09717.1 MAG: short-chain dehydrogenase [Novosphingobium sp. 28-62-57]HQS68393.1 SDR family NAD(P)-dependent oxidoreductase [Novosphingobium sp.]